MYPVDVVRPPKPSSCQPVDGGLLSFNREQGSYVLLRSPSFAAKRRVAPRVLQIALLTPCNLRCHFCYRDTAAASRLTREFLVPLLRALARLPWVSRHRD